MQIRGSVNLNYYIIFLLSVLQDKHKKFPYINSGLTSVVLVIVPEMETLIIYYYLIFLYIEFSFPLFFKLHLNFLLLNSIFGHHFIIIEYIINT